MKLRREETLLLIVDVQEKLAPAMDPQRFAALLANVERFASAVGPLEVPVIVTEQYPQGLGPSVPAVLGFDVPRLPKKAFSAWADPAIAAAIQASGRTSIVVMGMEAHICVYQTARDLAEAGMSVHVLADGVASRTEQNLQIGLELVRKSGCTVSSTEVVLFDLLGEAGSDAFKVVSRLVR